MLVHKGTGRDDDEGIKNFANFEDAAQDDATAAQGSNDFDDNPLLANSTRRQMIPSGDIHRVRFSSMAKSKRPTASRQVNMHEITYSLSQRRCIDSPTGALVDRGANGCIGGENVCVVNSTSRTVHIQGIDHHQVPDILLVTLGAKVQSQRGPVIAIVHQAAYTGRGPTILSSGQLEHFGVSVDDKSRVVGGSQSITTLDGYIFPLSIKHGLPYLPMVTFTDTEYNTLPHVVLTANTEWDPTVLDSAIDDGKHDAPIEDQTTLGDNNVNDVDHTHNQRVMARIVDCLRSSGFYPLTAEPGIWLRDPVNGENTDYVALYADDLLITSDRPHRVIDLLLSQVKDPLYLEHDWIAQVGWKTREITAESLAGQFAIDASMRPSNRYSWLHIVQDNVAPHGQPS